MEREFRTAVRVTWLVAGTCVLCIGAMFVFPLYGIDWRKDFWFLFFSVPLLLFCLILLPILSYYRTKYLSGAKGLLDGDYLAHWRYHKDEWTGFAESEWKRTRRNALWTPLGIFIGIPILGYLFKNWTVDDYKLILPWIAGLGVLAALIIYLSGLSSYRRMLNKTGEVFIGNSGVYFNDTYYTWTVVGSRLGKVELIEGDPSVIQFEILYVSRTGSRPLDIRVPVPRAHEKEASKLVSKLSRR